MKKTIFGFLVLFPLIAEAQIGLKGGINFANVTKVSSINNNSRTGYGVSLFLAPKPKGILGYRSEIGYSRQGYSFDTNTNTGSVNLDYILLPQLSTINITKFFQIQLGAQAAFLINSKATESDNSSNPYGKLLDYYNRFDYGVAGGLEIHPFKGLLIGGRYNLSLGNLYKKLENMTPGTVPSFIPDVNVKNNVVNLYIGYHFVK
jgi:hypothetical protein